MKRRLLLSTAVALALVARPAAAQQYDPVRGPLGSVPTILDMAKANIASALAAYDSIKALPPRVDTVAVVDTVVRVDTAWVKPDSVLVTDTLWLKPDSILVTDTVVTVDTVYAILDNGQLEVMQTVPPTPPQDSVDVTMPALSGRVLRVAIGQALQPALDSARAGDVVELEAGGTWHGPVRLNARGDSGVVVVRSSRAAELPPGVRVTPGDSVKMARLIGGEANASVLVVPGGSSGWRIIGLEVEVNPDTSKVPGIVTAIVNQGYGSSNVVFDRTYIHANPLQGVQRCVALNGARAAVIDSHLDDCHAVGTDAQAIEGWYGPGPYLIQNNYLAGSGENIMFGGAAIGGGKVPSDIIIRGNLIHKPDTWKVKTPFDWAIKNLIEIKMAQRLLIEDNVLDGSWADAQEGYAVIIKSENRDLPEHPEFYTSDVIFRRNVIRNSRYGIAFDGTASTSRVSGPNHTRRVLVEDVDMHLTDDFGRAVILLAGVKDARLNRVRSEGRVYLENGGHVRFRMENSCTSYVMGSGITEGTTTLAARAPEYAFLDNTVVGLGAQWRVNRYPQGDGNTYPLDATICFPAQ